jgi:hypothetical protein
MTHRTIKYWLPAALLASTPAVAHADAGTPLMWASTLHLFLGNAAIGIAEGLLLAMLFRQRRAGCVLIMIAANYFSAWAGGLLLASRISDKLDLDLYNAWPWLWGMVAITYFLTLLLEWPFVALCLRKSDGWFRKSLRGSLVVQSASYVVLFGWYWGASATELYTDLAVVQPSAMTLTNSVILYYIADNSRTVCARDLGQGGTRKIAELKPRGHRDRLLLQESHAVADRWDLVVESENRGPSPSNPIVTAGLACTVAEPPAVRFTEGGEVPRFRADSSGWEFRFGWMAGGLYGNNARDGRLLNVRLETPFLKWPVQYPTQLPNGQVVFQLGTDQICVLDPNERKIALLVKGCSPVVTLKEPQSQTASFAAHQSESPSDTSQPHE